MTHGFRKKSVYVAIVTSVSLLGIGACMSRPAPLVGYHPVYNQLRLSGSQLPLLTSNGVIKVAVQPGRLPATIAWNSIEVTNGALTIVGKNGTLCLGSGNTFMVNIEDFGCYTGKLDYVWIELELGAKSQNDEDQKLVFCIYYDIIKQLELNYPNLRDYSLRQKMSPCLYSFESNGWRHVEIPYFVSTNFQGNIGELTLLSNWYEF